MCECCGDRVKINGINDGSTKYCGKCKKQKQLEWNRAYKRKLRENKDS